MGKEDKMMVELAVKEAIEKFYGLGLTEDEKDEVWMTGDELMQVFHWAPSWITRYGQFLPRQKPEGCNFLYPKNQIQKMFKNGEIKSLTNK